MGNPGVCHTIMNVTSLPYNHERYQSAIQSCTLPVCHTIMNVTSLPYNHERYQSAIQSWTLPVCQIITYVTSLPYNHERYQSVIQSWKLPVCQIIMNVTSMQYNHERYYVTQAVHRLHISRMPFLSTTSNQSGLTASWHYLTTQTMPEWHIEIDLYPS